MIVVDTNLVLYLLIPGEHTEAARITFQKEPEWVAPSFWRIEFLNVLATYCRTKRLTVAQALGVFGRASELVRDMPFNADAATILELAVRSGCSGYDCNFVAAAKMNKLPLITFDQKLLKAFPETAITPELIEDWFLKREQTE